MTPCGTVGYTAPEIVKDERYSKSVDMWALGCVLYTILCGFPPFYDESIQALTEKVARGEYTFLSPWWDSISAEAKDLVSHLLTVDPDKRYSIHDFLAHPWIQQAIPVSEETPIQQESQVSSGVPQRISSQNLEDSSNARRMDFRSPGAINLREVFDVGYAVHRQEEESKRRNNFRQTVNRLQPLSEDHDDDDDDAAMTEGEDPPTKIYKTQQQAGDVAGVEAKLRNTSLDGRTTARKTRAHHHQQQGGYGQHSAAVAAAAREKLAQNALQPFELHLDHATLLERRGRRHQQQQLQQQQVA